MWTTTFLALVHLLPGIGGVLSRGSVLVCSLVLAGVALMVARKRRPAGATRVAVDEPFWPRDGERRWASLLALAAAAAAAGTAVAFLAARSPYLVTAVDATTVHLPVVVRWIQAQSVWPVVQYAPDLSTGLYPENGTLMMLAAVLPWHSIFAARYV